MTIALDLQIDEPLRGGLMDNSRELPVSETEWREGVQVTSQCNVDGGTWGCGRAYAEDGGETKTVNELGPTDIFESTTIYNVAECNVAGSRSLIGNRQELVAREGLDVVKYSLMADVLYTGEVGIGELQSTPNPSFFSTARIPEGQNYLTPSSITNTMTGLIEVLCAQWRRQVVFHVPIQFMPQMLNSSLVVWDWDRNRYYMGNYPVSFDCYLNYGPESAVDPVPNVDGSELWIYMSSIPYISFGDEGTDGYTEVQINRHTERAERGAIATFDPCSVWAAKASVYDV